MHIQSINKCNWLTLVFIKSNGSFHLCTISIFNNALSNPNNPN